MSTLNIPQQDALNYDVLIVSAGARGNYLAAELSKNGNKVLCIDLTSQLGIWPPEDMMGPFGEFALDRYSSTYKEMLNHGDPFRSVQSGFTVLHEDGPLEYRGSLTKNMLEKLNLDSKVVQYLADQQMMTDESQKIPFSHRWPLTLIQSVATTYDDGFDFGLQYFNQRNLAIPVHVEFLKQQPTRPGLERLNEWVKLQNVKLTSQTTVVDFRRETQGRLTAVELQGEMSGLYKFKQLIWCLNSEETYYVSKKLGQLMYPDGVNEALWSWVRYRVQILNCEERERLPESLVILKDRYSSWTHENFLILQRTAVEDYFDVWMKIPNTQRFNKDYLREYGDRIESMLKFRFGGFEVKIQTLPQEYIYTWKDLGPCRFPVYDKKKIKFKGPPFSNVQIDSAEIRGSYSKPAQFDDHQKLIQFIQNWKNEEKARIAKQEQLTRSEK